ncbi:MAG: hypothetical protein IJO60_06740 [Agathobacter sp.]|nr:hypothetical protein [Agathobacter sp.]
MTYFDERLKELHRQKAQKKRLEAMKAELLKQEDEVAKKATELEQIKKKEQLDVDKLEGKTIKALFFTLAGTKEEKLSQERQEAYVAAMKYDAAKRDLEGIVTDLRYCQDELDKLTDCEAEYEHLLEQKKNSIKQEASKRANEVMLLERDLSTLGHEIVELEEALDVGYKAFDLVDDIVKELQEAHDLADWDTFMDSFLIDMQKQEHIHTAQDLIQDLRQELRRFKTELADVNIDGDIQIEMDEFSEFADWFFDNIFTDWDIKAKIENSQAQAEDTREQITTTINLLKDMRDERMKRRIELEEELEEVVVGE